MNFTRRDFLATAVAASTSLALDHERDAQAGHQDHPDHHSHDHQKPARPAIPRLPAILCKVTGTEGIHRAYDILKAGRDTLDAALEISKTQEDDPNDESAGLGALPNEAGEVELEACCLHGPSRGAGSVSAVSHIKNASLLARAVMERRAEVHLTGEGAQRFALAQRFPKEELLTERTRKMWDVWKQIRSKPDVLGARTVDSSSPQAVEQTRLLPNSQSDLETVVRKLESVAVKAGLGPQWTWRAVYDALFPASASLYISTINEKNEMSSVVTSSGAPWRPQGAAGDAFISAGLYLDPEIGSAGATGSAEPNIKIAGAHTVVENMRKGMSPEEAGMDALRRIAYWYKSDMNALRFVQMVYYILRKDGYYAGVSLWSNDLTGHARQFAIHDGVPRTEECLSLFSGNPVDYNRS